MGAFDSLIQIRQIQVVEEQTRALEAIARGEDPAETRRGALRKNIRQAGMALCWIVGIVFPPLWIIPIVPLVRTRRAVLLNHVSPVKDVSAGQTQGDAAWE